MFSEITMSIDTTLLYVFLGISFSVLVISLVAIGKRGNRVPKPKYNIALVILAISLFVIIAVLGFIAIANQR